MKTDAMTEEEQIREEDIERGGYRGDDAIIRDVWANLQFRIHDNCEISPGMAALIRISIQSKIKHERQIAELVGRYNRLITGICCPDHWSFRTDGPYRYQPPIESFFTAEEWSFLQGAMDRKEVR